MKTRNYKFDKINLYKTKYKISFINNKIDTKM